MGEEHGRDLLEESVYENEPTYVLMTGIVASVIIGALILFQVLLPSP